MKQTILLIFLFFFSNLLFSQARINWTEEQIKEDFFDYDFEKYYTDDGYYIFTDNAYLSSIAYFFDEYGYCDMTIILPDNQQALNFYVQNYNNKYVTISDTEWKAYTDNGVLIIKLVFQDNNSPYFVIVAKQE